jgi:hypothetical protein
MYIIKSDNPKIKKFGELFGITFWLVDEKKMGKDWKGKKPYIGGHHEVFQYIPENEIWISNQDPENKRFETGVHELTEYHLMKDKGMSYSQAHHIAWKAEGVDEGTDYITPEEIQKWLDDHDVEDVKLDKKKGILHIKDQEDKLIRSKEDLEKLKLR